MIRRFMWMPACSGSATMSIGIAILYMHRSCLRRMAIGVHESAKYQVDTSAKVVSLHRLTLRICALARPVSLT